MLAGEKKSEAAAGGVRRPLRGFLQAPPSGALISAVVQHADRILDLGGERSLMRLSGRRSRDPRICNPLGREARRLGDIAVIWDDGEDQILRVLDAAAGDDVAGDEEMDVLGDEQVQLTAEAAVYIEALPQGLH